MLKVINIELNQVCDHWQQYYAKHTGFTRLDTQAVVNLAFEQADYCYSHMYINFPLTGNASNNYPLIIIWNHLQHFTNRGGYAGYYIVFYIFFPSL